MRMCVCVREYLHVRVRGHRVYVCVYVCVCVRVHVRVRVRGRRVCGSEFVGFKNEYQIHDQKINNELHCAGA